MCTVSTHKKERKDHRVEPSRTAPDNTNNTGTQIATGSKKKKMKKKNCEPKLPKISDDRLKAYGINPKKFKYFHKKKLLEER